MPSREDLRGLLERVIRATTGSFELNVAVGRVLDSDFPGAWPEYSRSVDDALALVGRLLPGHRLTCSITLGGVPDGFAGISEDPVGPDGRIIYSHPLAQRMPSAPLAILAALLTALLAQETSNAG